MARLIDANALLRHKRKMIGADFGGEFWDEAVLASDIKNPPPWMPCLLYGVRIASTTKFTSRKF